MRGRRGLAPIIITLVLILLSLVAIGIIWVVIQNLIKSGADQIAAQQNVPDLKIQSVLVGPGTVIVSVNRNPGKANYSGIEFIFTNATNSESIVVNVSLTELQNQVFTFNPSYINTTTMTSVSIAPVYTSPSGQRTVGNILDTFNIALGQFNSSIIATGIQGSNSTGGGTNQTSLCGDGICNGTETVDTCPQDCLPTYQISSCRNINTSGNYVLQNSIKPTNVAQCFNINNTKNVYFDCRGNTIQVNYTDYSQYNKTAFSVSNVTSFSISNCNIQTNLTYDQLIFPLNITNSNFGIVANNVFFSFADVSVLGGTGMAILNNNYTESLYMQTNATNAYIANNYMNWSAPKYLEQALIWLTGNNFTTIFNNTLDGAGSGIITSVNHTGLDDDITLFSETGDNISGNIMQNTNDCAVESAYILANTTVSNNFIKNTSFCGIGGWYWSGWKNDVFSFNTVNNSGTLFTMNRQNPLLPGETNVYFTNNLFNGNILLGINSFRGYATDISMDQEAINDRINHSAFISFNATFINNNFDPNVTGPLIVPTSMIIDLGGNRCNPNTVGYRLPNGTVSTSTPLNCSS